MSGVTRFQMGMSPDKRAVQARLKEIGNYTFRISCGREHPCPHSLGILRNMHERWSRHAPNPGEPSIILRSPSWERCWRINPPEGSPGFGGYEDSGYIILPGNHRARNGQPIGRREDGRFDYADPSLSHPDWRRGISGQNLSPPCRVICRCGTVNVVAIPHGDRAP